MGWRDFAAAAAQREQQFQTPVVETFGLPDDLAADLRRLENLPPPRKIENADNWRSVVVDAMKLARDGWAAKAIALGWNAGDLFGIGPEDDWDFEGLAIWLRGRRIIILDSAKAIVAGNPADYRSAFIRGSMRHGTHPTITPVMLWDFGR